MFRKVSIWLGIIFLGIVLLEVPVIFQEGNPLPVVIGAYKLISGKTDLVKIAENPKKYMVKTRNLSGAANTPFLDFMRSEGYISKYQSAGDFLEKSGHYYQLNYNSFTEKYIIITVEEISPKQLPETPSF